MENIFHETLQAVQKGAKFNVDFPTRSLKVDNKYVIRNGKYEGELGVGPCLESHKFLEEVSLLYRLYKHSIPSEYSESKRSRYFYAFPENKLSDEDMMYGECRDHIQIHLELFILCQILLGFKWDEEHMGKWFWQGVDKDLVLLREWFEPNINN